MLTSEEIQALAEEGKPEAIAQYITALQFSISHLNDLSESKEAFAKPALDAVSKAAKTAKDHLTSVSLQVPAQIKQDVNRAKQTQTIKQKPTKVKSWNEMDDLERLQYCASVVGKIRSQVSTVFKTGISSPQDIELAIFEMTATGQVIHTHNDLRAYLEHKHRAKNPEYIKKVFEMYKKELNTVRINHQPTMF